MKRQRPAHAPCRLGMERLEERAMLAVNVIPTAQTAAASGADDIAIWIHPTDSSKSTIIGTAKTNSSSVRVYNLAGQQIQSVASSKVNNIDLRYNFSLGGQDVALVAGSNRSNKSIVLFKVDPNTGLLQDVAARSITTGISVYGLTMYVSPVSGKHYVFVSSESGQIQQWELFDNGAGKVDAKMVRSFSVGSQSEGMAADDVTGVLYIGEESKGVWRYSAEPNGGTARTSIDTTAKGGHLKKDVEGIAIYYKPDGTGYLLVSSQGSDEFAVYRREGNNQYLGNFKIVAGNGIDAVTVTDGIDVTNFALGSQYPKGVFIAQDNDSNFKMVKWEVIEAAFAGLITSDTSWDPRLVGGDGSGPTNQKPQVAAGGDQTIALGTSAVLDGTASDDGLPISPGALNYLWEKIGGPGTVGFGNLNAIDTSATFTTAGDYTLRLTANDGALSAYDDIIVHVTAAPTLPNPPTPPVSGPPQQIAFQNGLFPNVAYAGTIDTKIAAKKATKNYGDDTKLTMDGDPDEAGLFKWNVSAIPIGSTVTSVTIELNVTGSSKDSYEVYALQRAWDELSATWQSYATGSNWTGAGASGSGDQQSAVLGQMTATSKGVYRINLNAAGVAAVQQWVSDPSKNYGIIIKDYTTTKAVEISTSEAKTASQRPKLVINYTPNQPPVVDIVPTTLSVPVGQPLAIGATVSDDGQPVSSLLLTSLWTKKSGPGVATFGSDQAVNTTVAFDTVGTYVLKLTVGDTLLSGFDELTVSVT